MMFALCTAVTFAAAAAGVLKGVLHNAATLAMEIGNYEMAESAAKVF